HPPIRSRATDECCTRVAATLGSATVRVAKSGANPVLSRNCEAPSGDEPGRLSRTDARTGSRGRAVVRQGPSLPSSAALGGQEVAHVQTKTDPPAADGVARHPRRGDGRVWLERRQQEVGE